MESNCWQIRDAGITHATAAALAIRPQAPARVDDDDDDDLLGNWSPSSREDKSAAVRQVYVYVCIISARREKNTKC